MTGSEYVARPGHVSGGGAPAGDRLTRLLDSSAIGLSALCFAHCLAFPLLIAMLPTLDSILPGQWWAHPVILAIALPLAGWALLRSWRRHHDWRPAALGILGLSLMVTGLVLGERGWGETVFTVIGGLTLAAGHMLNWRLDGHHHVHSEGSEHRSRA